MKSLILILFAFPALTFAQEIDFNQLCDQSEKLEFIENKMSMNDKLFAILQEHEGEIKLYDHGLCPSLGIESREIKNKKKYEYSFRFYASHAFTQYFGTDIRIKTSSYDVLIEDYEILERGSREYFLPKTWKEDNNNPGQIFDEPTNTYTIVFEKGKNQISISSFHGKLLQNNDQVRRIIGKIRGQEVNHEAPIDANRNDEITNLYLARNANTFLQLEYTIGYGRRIDLWQNPSLGKLIFTPTFAMGIMTGKTNSVTYNPETQQLDYFVDPYRIQGYGFTLSGRIELRSPNERFSVFYEKKYGHFRQQHGILDGTQTYKLNYVSDNLGFSINLGGKKIRSRSTL